MFVSLFKQLIQNQEIKVSEDDEEYSDLKKLVQLGFLGIRNKNKKVALIVEESAKNFFENYFTVSKNESSTLFVSLFKQLIQNQEIKVSEDDEEYSDLKKLVQLGFLGIRNKNKKVALIVEESAKNFFENYLKDENICVSSLDEFITQDTLNILIEEKNNTKLNKIVQNYKNKYKDVDLIFVCSLYYENYLKGINKLTKLISIPYNIGFYDNNNIFATRIIHGETGCYQCLENQILQKFDGYIEDYVSEMDSEKQVFDIKNYGVLISIIKSEIEELNLYSDTELRGNVLHFYLPTYEYNFDKKQFKVIAQFVLL